MKPRPSLPSIAIQTAQLWATRSVCPRLKVGAIIVDHQWSVVSQGYNGPPAGMTHGPAVRADETGVRSEGCQSCVHAELNAIARLARRGGPGVEGMTIVSTHEPCLPCAQAIVQAGLSQVVYVEPYRQHAGLELLRAAQVGIAHFDAP